MIDNILMRTLRIPQSLQRMIAKDRNVSFTYIPYHSHLQYNYIIACPFLRKDPSSFIQPPPNYRVSHKQLTTFTLFKKLLIYTG